MLEFHGLKQYHPQAYIMLRKIIQLTNNLTIQLFISIIAAMVLGRYFDLQAVAFFYSLSSLFIQLLMLLLPVIVFVFVFSALSSENTLSFSLVLMIFSGVTLSNLLALTTSYFFAKLTIPFTTSIGSQQSIISFSSSIQVLFKLGLSNPVSTENSMLAAVFFGTIGMKILKPGPLKDRILKVTATAKEAISNFLMQYFIPILPLYVFGFCLKLSYDNALIYLVNEYGKVFLFSMILISAYMLFLYAIAASFNKNKMLSYIKTFVPAGLTGFSTMSSAVSIPISLECAQKATNDKEFSNLCIPLTANIHMLGDDLTIVMTSMNLLALFGMPLPSIAEFLPFAFAFSMAKFSCIGIPGASVLVILPVLQAHLGFSPEMITLATTIYVLQDPFSTTANVMGNGAVTIILKNAYESMNSVGLALLKHPFKKSINKSALKLIE